MSTYNIVMSTNESTVVTEYVSKVARSDSYQSEAALEAEFIKMLREQGYSYLPIHRDKELVDNLRTQLSLLNNFTFTDRK